MSTGFEALDQEIAGGLPVGSLVAIQAPPSAPVGLLLTRVMTPKTFDRGIYLTTVTPPDAITSQLTEVIPDSNATRDGSKTTIPERIKIVDARGKVQSEIESLATPAGREDSADIAQETEQQADAQLSTESSVATVDASQSNTAEEDSPVRSLNALCGVAGDKNELMDQTMSVVRVLDSISDVLGEKDAEGEQLLEQIVTHPTAQQGLTYVHLRIPDERPPTAVESRVLQRSDVVFEYQLARESDTPDELVISKLRRGTPPERCFPLEVTEHIRIKPDRRM